MWFTNANDVSLSTVAAGQTIDTSSHVPAGTTGAIVQIVNTDNGDHTGVVRGAEDSRDYMSNIAYEEIEADTQRYQIIKVSSDREIEGHIDDAGVDFGLVGYMSSPDPSYYVSPPDITPGTAGSWTAVEVSSNVSASADGVILFIDSVSASDQDYAIREVGGSVSATNFELEEYGSTLAVVGIDSNDEFDIYIETMSVKVYLISQTVGSLVFYSDDVSVSDPTLGSWQTTDTDSYSVNSEANGVILRVVNTRGTQDRKLSFRHGDSSGDWPRDVGSGIHFQAAVGLNGGNEWDEEMEKGLSRRLDRRLHEGSTAG